MSQKPERHSGREERDERYGQALAKTLQSAAPAGPCLSTVEIDALVEGRADPSDRERCLAHLANCESCLRSFGVAAELKREEKSAGLRTWRTGIPLALAVAMVLALAVTLSRHNGKQHVALRDEAQDTPQASAPLAAARQESAAPSPVQTPAAMASRTMKPASPEFAPALALLVSLPPTAAETKKESRRAFGYSAQDSAERSRFRAGGELLSARLAMARGDRAAAADLVRGAAARIPAASAPGADQLAGLAAALPTADPAQTASRLEQLYTPGPTVDPHVALGAWSQAVTIAATAHQSSFFATDWFTHTGETLAEGLLGDQASQTIREILALSLKARTPEEFARLTGLARDLKDIY